MIRIEPGRFSDWRGNGIDMLSLARTKLDMEHLFRNSHHRDFFRIFSAFALLSILAIVLVTGLCIFVIYKTHIFQTAERNAKSIGGAIVEQERKTLFSAGGLKDLSLHNKSGEMAEFDRRMKKYLKPFQMVKIKIFDLDRKIIYSTDATIIGGTVGANGNLDAALAGKSTSKLKTKTDVWDLDGELQFDLDLVETYLPLENEDGRILGVFEIYADVTPYRKEFLRIFSLSLAAIFAVLVLVFGVILFVLNQMNILIFAKTKQLIKTKDHLQKNQRLTQGLMDNAFDAIIVIDSDSAVIRWNFRAETLFGWTSAEAVGETLTDLIIPRQFHDGYRKGMSRYLETHKECVLNKQAELIARDKDGKEFPVELTVSSLAWDQMCLFIGVVRDISKRKQMEQELIDLTHRDSLTGIANRRCFNEYGEREWLRAIREKIPFSLMLIDVDYFKLFNDHYGHPRGDECLKRVSACLKANLDRPTDLVARYGGEEFVVILPNTNEYGLGKIAERLLAAVETLGIEHARSKVSDFVTISAGGATTVATPRASLEAVIKSADEALYRAKKASRNCFEIANVEVNSNSSGF